MVASAAYRNPSRRGATIAAAISATTSSTPRPLRTPPLAFRSSVIANTSVHACSESCTLNSSRNRRSDTWNRIASAR